MCNFTILFALPLLAHDLYFLPPTFRVKPGEKIRIAFHNGDAFPESETTAPIARLRDTNVLASSGVTAMTNLRERGKEVLADAPSPGVGNLLLTARSIPNFIGMDPDKFDEYIREEGLDHVTRWRSEHGEAKEKSRERYSKYVKSILVSGAPNEFFSHVVGFTIEIVPEADPSLLKPGSKLPVRVLFRGKPAPGLQIEAAVAPIVGKTKVTIIGRTGDDGRIFIPIDNTGRWRIHTLLMERCADPKVADWESFWASLTFEN